MQDKSEIVMLKDIPDDFSKDFLADSKVSERCRKQAMSYVLEGYVHNVTSEKREDEEKIILCGKCYRSQRKSEKPHKMTIHLAMPDCAVVDSICSCVAG